MKKLIAMLLALVMCFGLFAGCTGNADETNDTADTTEATENPYASMTIEELKPLLQTINEGKLTMVTSPDFAPYEFYALNAEGDPTLAGFDIALGQYIANYLGLELDVITMDFDGTITELGMGNADIGMAGYSPDPKREKAMNFSNVYYTGGQAFICHVDNVGNFTSLEDINNPDYQIGAQLSSIQYDLALEYATDTDIVTLSKVTDIVAEVISGKLDGAFVEKVVAESYAKRYHDMAVVLDVPYEQEGSVIGVNKDNLVLLAAVNLAIEAAIEDGSMTAFIEEANNMASGDTYAGLLDEEGNVPDAE